MSRSTQWPVVLAAVMLGGTLAACTTLTPPAVDEISVYVLDAQPAMGTYPSQPREILGVSTPRAWPGFGTSRMAYVRQRHELEYFTKSRWADVPARMLAPLLLRAIAQSGAFGAVVPSPGAVAATLRLDTELVRVQQEFQDEPSRVRVTLRAQLVDVESRRVLGAREFEEVEAAAAGNAYAGVVALNLALERLLPRLVEFCASAAASR